MRCDAMCILYKLTNNLITQSATSKFLSIREVCVCVCERFAEKSRSVCVHTAYYMNMDYEYLECGIPSSGSLSTLSLSLFLTAVCRST